MKNFFRLSILTVGLLLSTQSCVSTCEFAIIIPSYNNEKYVEDNLDSVCWQASSNPYHIYYVNDCSTDSTRECVEAYIKKNKLEDKITLITNKVNIGGGANIYNTVHKYIADNKVVAILDGDDLFPHNNVLMTLERYYEDPEIWMTYGILRSFPDQVIWGEEIPEWILQENQIRKHAWITALRTFKSALFKKVKEEDFYYKGAFMEVTWDLAFVLPMLEMCLPENDVGKRHSVLINEVLYLY